jgi:DNA replication protein DnaC
VTIYVEESTVKLSRLPITSYYNKRLHQFEYREGAELAVKAVFELLNGVINVPMLMLIGVSGLGKSHLAIGAGWYWMTKGGRCIYYQVEDMLDDIRRGYSFEQSYQLGGRHPDSYSVIMSRLEKVGLLIMDDLGAHNETDFAYAKLDQIVCYRYDNNLPTIITTNKSVKEDLSRRIVDRCKDGRIVVMRGESYRGTKRNLVSYNIYDFLNRALKEKKNAVKV